MAEVAVPQFVNGIMDELGLGVVSGFKCGVDAGKDCMGGFMACSDNGRCIIRDCKIGQRACRNGEFSTSCGSVGMGWLDDADQVVLPILIIEDVEEEGVEDFAESVTVVVRGLVCDWWKRCRSSGKQRSYFFGYHGRGDGKVTVGHLVEEAGQ